MKAIVAENLPSAMDGAEFVAPPMDRIPPWRSSVLRLKPGGAEPGLNRTDLA